MGIVDEDVARVRDATDFVQLASEHLALKKVGRRWVGLCPFHAEKTPSFQVNAEEKLFYCFGCQAKGDVITFVCGERGVGNAARMYIAWPGLAESRLFEFPLALTREGPAPEHELEVGEEASAEWAARWR